MADFLYYHNSIKIKKFSTPKVHSRQLFSKEDDALTITIKSEKTIGSMLLEKENELLTFKSLQKFCECMPVAVLLLDFDLTLSYFNQPAKEFCRLHGLKECCDSSITLKDIYLHPTLKEELNRIRSKVLQPLDEAFPMSGNIYFKISHAGDDMDVVFHIHFIPFSPTNQISGAFMIYLDKKSSGHLKHAPHSDIKKLTQIELLIAQKAAEGLTNAEIAFAYKKSPATVRNQMHSIFKKLNLYSRIELVKLMQSS